MSSHTINSIYAPNIRLFNYHLKTVRLTNFTERSLEIEFVTNYYQYLLNSYNILDQNSKPIYLKLREDFQDMLGSGLANFDLIFNPEGRGIYRIALPQKYKGFLYPQFLNNTYSFSLTLYHPQKSGDDEISFSELSKLKPPEDFFAGISPGSQDETQSNRSKAFWGSTVFLSGFIAQNCPDTAENLKSTADQLLKQFLGIESLEEAPPFYESGKFLGGYIYEYKSIFRQHRYGQILILLIFDEATTDKLNDIQYDLPELFLYYQKNRQIFLDSRKEYRASQDEIQQIEETIQKCITNIPTNVTSDLSEKDLKLLKREIKNLLDWSLGYSQRIRSLGNFQNTIEINRQNYLNTLTRMEVKSQSDLTGWRDNANHIFGMFQRQIKVDLVYLQQGERLLDTAINTIRGLVEIDQAERDRSLERQIQAVGVGIAAGAIVASTSGLITEPWQLPNRDRFLLPPHPFIIALVGSFFCSWGAWWVADKLMKKGRSDSNS